MKKKTSLRKVKRRIVLGVGHPWYSSHGFDKRSNCPIRTALWPNGWTAIQLTEKPVPRSILLRGYETLVSFNTKDTGNWNKVRLVMEVLK